MRVYNIRRFYGLRELYEADFHKPWIYGSERVWANAWDVFRRMLSRVGRGRRAAVDFVACFGWGGFFRVSFSFFLFFERKRPTASMRPPCLIYLSTSTSISASCAVVRTRISTRKCGGDRREYLTYCSVQQLISFCDMYTVQKETYYLPLALCCRARTPISTRKCGLD